MVNASLEIVVAIFIQEARKTREPLFMEQVAPYALTEQTAAPYALTVEPHILSSIAELFIETI